MSTDFYKIQDYYENFNEWDRLSPGEIGHLEYQRTRELIERDLLIPHSAAQILDLGGGPGRYAVSLAGAGHQVTLCDISETQLSEARRRASEKGVELETQLLNATDLSSLPAESFDLALVLGPFYHLTSAAEQQQAVRHLARVLKPGAQALVAFIPYLDGLRSLIQRAAAKPEQCGADELRIARQTGIFHNKSGDGFQEGIYLEAELLAATFQRNGFEVIDTLSVRGLGYERESSVMRLQHTEPTAFAAVWELIEATCRDEAVIAMCGHALHRLRRQS